MTPEDKGKLLQRYVQLGRSFVIDEPGYYYPPAALHEPPRWERLDFSGANAQGMSLARDVVLERFNDGNIYRDEEVLAEIKGANLEWAQLDGANFRGADLRKANLRGAILTDADLRDCNLEDADLSNAELDRANLAGANLRGVNLEGARLAATDMDSLRSVERARIAVDTFRNSGWTTHVVQHLFERGVLFVGLDQFPDDIRRLVLGDGANHELGRRIAVLQERLAELEAFHTRARRHGGVFISYAHADNAFVSQLVERLSEDGINVWRDEKEILVGDVIDRAISEGIQQSWIFIVVLTPSSIGSRWVAREFDEASHEEIEGRKIVLPVLSGGLVLDQLPPRVRRKRCAVFDTAFDTSYAALRDSIFAHFTRQARTERGGL